MTPVLDYCGVVAGKPPDLVMESVNEKFINGLLRFRLPASVDSVQLGEKDFQLLGNALLVPGRLNEIEVFYLGEVILVNNLLLEWSLGINLLGIKPD